jgi:hypothetical protein
MLHLPKVASISSCVCPTNRKDTNTSSKIPVATNMDQKQNTYLLLLSFQHLSNYTWRIGSNLRLGINGREVPKDSIQSSFSFSTASKKEMLPEFTNNTPDDDAGSFSKSQSSFAMEPTVWLESPGYRSKKKCANLTSLWPWTIIPVTAMGSCMNESGLFVLLAKQGKAVCMVHFIMDNCKAFLWLSADYCNKHYGELPARLGVSYKPCWI